MTSTLGSKPVISRTTLALLEDSGWYLPDYSYASRLTWGFHQGCHFANSTCKEWLEYAYSRKMTPCNRSKNRKDFYDTDKNKVVVDSNIYGYSCDLPSRYQV